MKLIPLIFALLILIGQLTPVIAVNSKEVTVEKTTKLEVKEASKDKVTVKEFISTASGDSKVKSKDISLKTEKLDKSLKISSTTKTKSKSVDSHDILVPVADIQNFNGHSVRITHFTDDGIQDHEYIQEVTVRDGYVLIQDVEFSSIVVDGFTGTKTEVSYNVNVTDTSFTVTENGSLTITLDGVPDGVEINENDSSTYPQSNNMLVAMPMYNGTNIVDYSGSIDGVYESGKAIFDGTHGIISNNTYDFGNNYTFYTVMNTTVDSRGIFDTGFDEAVTAIQLSNRALLYAPNTTTGYFLYSGTGDVPLSTETSLIVRRNNNIVDWYNNYELSSSSMLGEYTPTYTYLKLGMRGTGLFMTGYMDLFCGWNISLSDSDITILKTKYSGTSAKIGENGEWQPVINGTVTFDNVTTEDTIYFLSANDSVIATSLTKEYSYTQDYTLIEESETADNVQVQINATAGANMTESQLVYDVSSLNFTHNMSISSNNPNVTGTYHNGTVTLDTGLLNFGDSFNCTLTFDKLTSFTFWANWISKTSTKAVVEYNSTNSNVENDFYLENMSASSTFDFKYSNGTILTNATSDSNGYLKFDDVGGVTDTYKLINDTYTIEKQTSATTFVAVVFTGLSFVGLYFVNRFRRR